MFELVKNIIKVQTCTVEPQFNEPLQNEVLD